MEQRRRERDRSLESRLEDLERSRGRLVELQMRDGTVFIGHVESCDDTSVVLLCSARGWAPSRLPIDEIRRVDFRSSPGWVVPWQLRPRADRRGAG